MKAGGGPGLHQVKMIPSVYPVREMAKKSKNKPDKAKKVVAVDDLISDIDLEDEDEEFEQSHFKETDLSKLMGQKSKGKKTKGSTNMKYEEFIETCPAELLWSELQDHLLLLRLFQSFLFHDRQGPSHQGASRVLHGTDAGILGLRQTHGEM